MPVSDVWGATIDRTVSGKITLTLVDGSRPDRLPVTVTVPWDGTKATKSDLRAAFEAALRRIGMDAIDARTQLLQTREAADTEADRAGRQFFAGSLAG